MDKFGISEVVTNLATCERAGPPTANNWFPANLLRQMDTSQADDQYHGSGAYSRGPVGPASVQRRAYRPLPGPASVQRRTCRPLSGPASVQQRACRPLSGPASVQRRACRPLPGPASVQRRACERKAEGLQALIRACERTAKGLQAAIMPGICTGRDSNEATDLSVGILARAALQTF